MFFKAKLPKESQNGFKTISCHRYPVMFFSKNYFWYQKSSKKLDVLLIIEFFALAYWGRNFSFVFLEELKTQKSPFEIN